MHALLFFQIQTTESAGTLRPCIFWHGRNIHNECKEKSSCHVWCMVDIITFLQHHKSFFQFCKLFLAPTYLSVPLFFAPKQMLWQEQWRLSRKCQKTFAKHYEHGEYALMKEWHDNLWNIIKKSAHL